MESEGEILPTEGTESNRDGINSQTHLTHGITGEYAEGKSLTYLTESNAAAVRAWKEAEAAGEIGRTIWRKLNTN